MALPAATDPTQDPLAGLKAAMADTYFDPAAAMEAHLGGPMDPTNPRAAVNRLGLALAGPSEAELASARAIRDLQDSDPDYALSRQRDEILNERGASAAADAQFGDSMAARALQRAINSKLGLNNAEDLSQLTQAHEQVVQNQGDEAMRREAPKIQSAVDIQGMKSNADIAKADAANALAAGKINAQEYAALVAAQAKVYGSPFAAQGGNITQPAPVTAPTMGNAPTGALNAAVATRTGGAGGQTYSPTQEALIARMLNSPGGRGKTRADAIAVLDRTKPQGWQ